MLTFVFVTMQILRKLKHENIIAMLDSFESPQEFCVVTEFAQVIITSFSKPSPVNSSVILLTIDLSFHFYSRWYVSVCHLANVS